MDTEKWQAKHAKRMAKIYAKRGRVRSKANFAEMYLDVTQASQAGVAYTNKIKVFQAV